MRSIAALLYQAPSPPRTDAAARQDAVLRCWFEPCVYIAARNSIIMGISGWSCRSRSGVLDRSKQSKLKFTALSGVLDHPSYAALKFGRTDMTRLTFPGLAVAEWVSWENTFGCPDGRFESFSGADWIRSRWVLCWQCWWILAFNFACRVLATATGKYRWTASPTFNRKSMSIPLYPCPVPRISSRVSWAVQEPLTVYLVICAVLASSYTQRY